MKLVRSTESARPRVVIVGGGFAGLRVARGLRRSPVDVTLIDRSNHHLFQPLLYQVATAGLGGPDIAAPLRKVLERQANTRVWMAEVQRIDREARIVVTDRGPVEYDYLVVAAGATHSYFNNPDWAENAPGLKTLADALEIRRRVLRAFEAAETESNEQLRRALLTFVVVGAGPTGVELAGAIAEMARHTLPGQYRAFDPSQARVLLVEQSERVLPTYPTRLSDKAREQLERLGVEVKTSCRVSGLDDEKVLLRDQALACRTVLWAAGVQASPLARALNAPLDRFGRVQVQWSCYG